MQSERDCPKCGSSMIVCAKAIEVMEWSCSNPKCEYFTEETVTL